VVIKLSAIKNLKGRGDLLNLYGLNVTENSEVPTQRLPSKALSEQGLH